MKYLVEAHATMERGDAIDQKGGPAALFAYIAERFKPEAFYGNASRRQVFLIVELPTEADVAELMYIFAWAVGAEPTFTPVLAPDVYGQAIASAKRAPTL